MHHVKSRKEFLAFHGSEVIRGNPNQMISKALLFVKTRFLQRPPQWFGYGKAHHRDECHKFYPIKVRTVCMRIISDVFGVLMDVYRTCHLD